MNYESGESKIVWVLFVVIVLLVGTIVYGYIHYNDLLGEEKTTPVATVTTTPVVTASTTPTTTVVDNVFDLSTAKVGDKVGTMTIASIEPYFPEQSTTATTTNCKIKFSGEATITGEYSYVNTALAGYMLTFGLDTNQNPQLPVLSTDKNSSYPQINSIFFQSTSANLNSFGIKNNIEKTGNATIKITNFFINHAPSEVMNTADLVEVISK